MKKILYLIIISILVANQGTAQSPKKWNTTDIKNEIKRLNTLASVLYVAAHPDDENTRLISYISSHEHMNITYLSLTRGDGGQNLIGTELRENLGVLRTQELLMARGVDGGKQMFSRANDFGYSKNSTETLRIWNKKEVLADVIWAIRKLQPDVIINRFPLDTTFETHGHHTSSALLSNEAFDMAADPTVYPEQLQYVKVWQPKRLFYNTSWWFYGSRENFEKQDKSKLFSMDIGCYYPEKGKSNNEIAAESRSMHKCQGFGSSGVRGSEIEYLDFMKGSKPSNNNLFENIDITWKRLPNGAPIEKTIEEILAEFDNENPSKSIPKLLNAYQLIQKLEDGYWKGIKLEEIKQIIKSCAGLYIEAISSTATAIPNQAIDINIECINRSNASVKLQSISNIFYNKENTTQKDTIVNANLDFNKKKSIKWGNILPKDINESSPYWLRNEATLGMYTVDQQLLRGLPETPRSIKTVFNITINEVPIAFTQDLVFKYENPAKGEIYKPFEITQRVFVNQSEKVIVFGDNKPKNLTLTIKANDNNLKGKLTPKISNGWNIEPKTIDFATEQKGEEKVIHLMITPPKDASSQLNLEFEIDINGKKEDALAVRYIEYDHIPTQTVTSKTVVKLVKLDIIKKGQNIGYYVGAGDDMPACLEQIGYKVTLLEDRNFKEDNLKQFDAIIMGIRAYNTKEKLKFQNKQLLDYVKNGGNLILQYNTANKEMMKDIGPFPFKLSNDRTTVEEAEIRILKPNHPVLNLPNKITSKDFDGWVQERGLYFPNEWDKNYDAILGCNDPGEPSKDGGLLIAKYGKGNYTYTGYSWFRELPAGVPGAYRLFANIISLGKK
jgi:LmbE family N-acetylglucosaminyl deacetylase